MSSHTSLGEEADVSVLTAAEWDGSPDAADGELVDGVVRPRAVPTPAHERVKAKLLDLLTRLAMPSMAVVMDFELRLDDLLRRRPDLLVTRAAGLDHQARRVDPEQVILVVEVVCRGSETTDRKHKPIEYADADLPHFWRVETTSEVGVHTYRLGENSFFLETGLFRQDDLVFDPTLRWASFELAELTGRAAA
jgi:Uma2 family endonuclease